MKNILKITSYYIDENNVLHTYIGNTKHVTISDVFSDKEALEIIEKLENETINY